MKFLHCVCVEKRKIVSHEKKNRQINSLVKSLLSRNFYKKGEREFLEFPHCVVHRRNLHAPKK